MEEINERISNEFSNNIFLEISDNNLIDDYIKTKSVKKEIEKLENILNKYINDNTIKNNIINDYLLELIPPGTKGVIRGNKFNNIIKNYILNLNLDKNRFIISFEKKCDYFITDEIPDWYIYDLYNNKVIIGMNQLDLWNGGQQINRGYKYILNNNYDNINNKLLCIVCNKIILKSKNNKIYKLFEIGFKNNTLCYINNLKFIILSFFF
jgi:hypothetical protein